MAGSAQAAAGARDRRAAQKFFRLHRLAAGALQFDEPHRAAARRRSSACRRARVPGVSLAVALGRAQNLDAAGAGKLAPGAGKRRQPAAMIVDLVPRLASNRCASRSCRSCWRRSRPRRLAASTVSEPRSSAPSATSISLAPSRASSSCNSPVVASAPIGTRSRHGDRRRCRDLRPSSSPSRRSRGRRP